MFISSSKSHKTATSYWTAIGRRMLEPTKERYLTPKDKEKAIVRWSDGCNHDKIKSHTRQVGDPQNGEQWYQRSAWTVLKVLNPTSGFPAWGSNKGTANPQGIWPWRPTGFDYRPSRGLRETETPVLEVRHKQNFAHIKTQRKGVVIPQEAEPKLPASVGGPPV